MSEVFETTDIERAEGFLSGAYARMRIGNREGPVSVRMSQTVVDSAVRLDQLNCATRFDVDGHPLGVLVIGEVKAGCVRYRSDGSQRCMRPGQVYLTAQPGQPFTASVDNAELELAVIDPVLLSKVADTADDRAQEPVRLTGYEPVSPRAARQWHTTSAFAREVMRTLPDGPARPLVAGSLARLLAAAALAAFSNNALIDPASQDRRDAHAGTLRRAITYIEEHAAEDITAADIASAASVSIRAVQLVFRRHLDTTPMEYLRRVRLDAAHRDLFAADPSHATVTAVAYRWGFASPSRFATYYRQAYGVSPSDTLRRD